MPSRFQVQAFEVLLSYRTQHRELRQSNPEIRRTRAFFCLVRPEPFSIRSQQRPESYPITTQNARPLSRAATHLVSVFTVTSTSPNQVCRILSCTSRQVKVFSFWFSWRILALRLIRFDP